MNTSLLINGITLEDFARQVREADILSMPIENSGAPIWRPMHSPIFLKAYFDKGMTPAETLDRLNGILKDESKYRQCIRETC